MALAEVASYRFHCMDCRNEETMTKAGGMILARQGGSRCRCRFVVDFFVGRAAQVWLDIEALLKDPFDGA